MSSGTDRCECGRPIDPPKDPNTDLRRAAERVISSRKLSWSASPGSEEIVSRQAILALDDEVMKARGERA